MTTMDGSAHEAARGSDGVVVVSDVPPELIEDSLTDPTSPISSLSPMVYRALAEWAEEPQSRTRRPSGIMNRDRFVTPTKVYEQMGMAYDASDDDIVSQFLDTSEAIAFQKVSFDSDDEDQANIWNQMGKELNLDEFVRQAWRELSLVSQYYGVRNFARRTYRVKGKRDQREARKEYSLIAPQNLGFLDPTRVVPVSVDPFGNTQLAWLATDADKNLYKEVTEGPQNDDLVAQLFAGPYQASKAEAKEFQKEGIDVDNLMLLNPLMVWRHTLTKSTYERWARLRMKSIFPLLDLKHQVREMDRAFLLGGINFIVLVTRGTDALPAKTADVSETAQLVRTQAKSPIIVSDHRISIEIITPDLDNVLNEDKWGVLDARIMLRLWGGFGVDQGSNSDTLLTMARVIARGFSSRRHMMKRDIEKNIIDMTQRFNEEFDAETKLNFSPRRIELDFDATLMSVFQDLRDRGDLSRETFLQEFDFSQATEARRRKAEDEKYGSPEDEKGTFSQTNVPFNSPENQSTPGGSGRRGGRPRTQPQEQSS